MATTLDVHDSNAVLDHLGSVLPVIRVGLLSGIEVADSHFERRGRRPDPWLWSHIVREELAAVVSTHSVEADWEMVPRMPLSSVEIRRRPCVVRVLKTRGGGPPPPGRSVRKRALYTQQNLFAWRDATYDLEAQVGANFIVDWTYDPSTRGVALHLSRPIGAWAYGQERKLEWRREVEVAQGAGLVFRGSEEHDVLVEALFDMDDFRAVGG